ncbi:JHBP domain-containing protein, partial [bacterium LRH843]|nr:JHBP domain-containing protein [bacterium LRH843]
RVVADPEKYSLDLYITVPNYNIEGLYKAKGKIIVLPIQGEGDSYFKFMGIKAVWKIKGEPKVKNGKTHMKITKFDVEIVPKDLKM